MVGNHNDKNGEKKPADEKKPEEKPLEKKEEKKNHDEKKEEAAKEEKKEEKKNHEEKKEEAKKEEKNHDEKKEEKKEEKKAEEKKEEKTEAEKKIEFIEKRLDEKKPLKFLFVSFEALIGDLAWQVKKEGHEVKYYIQDKGERDVCDGFVDKIDDWKAQKDWADVIIFDDIGFGALVEALRKDGKLVVGGATYADRLEDDREFGQEELHQGGGERPSPLGLHGF